MKFMEIDEGGYVHHICDDPGITMVPIVNRISHGDKDKAPLVDAVGRKVSFLGNKWLPPLPISDSDYAQLTTDGLTGVTAKNTKWHYQYNAQTKTFTKVTVL